MIGKADLSGQLALDVKGMGELRQAARAKNPDALRGAATQFEAMFINMMMKSMRDATPQDGPMDSEQTKMFTSMLDQQTSQNLAKRGIGLADMMIKQLSSQNNPLAEPGLAQAAASAGIAPVDAPASKSTALSPLQDITAAARAKRPVHIQQFQDKLASHAEEASRATGVPAKFMLGQAALESGWGKREIKMTDGSPTHNLFGIKAGPGWKGKVASAVTTEYVNGVPQTKVEKFRAYDSYAEGFRDYANMLTRNPRYEKVLANAQDASSFAHGLQKAGYATDPFYAAKLTRIIKHSLLG